MFHITKLTLKHMIIMFVLTFVLPISLFLLLPNYRLPILLALSVIGIALLVTSAKNFKDLTSFAYAASLEERRRNYYESNRPSQSKERRANISEETLAELYRRQANGSASYSFEEGEEEDLYRSSCASARQELFIPEAIKYFGFSYIPSEIELKKVYRRKSKTMHPDRGGNPKEFVHLNKMYDEALDIVKKNTKYS